jgi:hypothetical protein
MGKRTSGKFARNKRDLYITPASAALPLLGHLPPKTRFDEPCCGNGALVRHLQAAGHECTYASDITPLDGAGAELSVFELSRCYGEVFITNPPWTRAILHPLIAHLSSLAPTWLLFDADWKHTVQAAPYLDQCRKVVSVGRVKWIADSKHTGLDNAAWYLFDRHHRGGPTFHGRQP